MIFMLILVLNFNKKGYGARERQRDCRVLRRSQAVPVKGNQCLRVNDPQDGTVQARLALECAAGRGLKT